jgi:hypothetical protein
VQRATHFVVVRQQPGRFAGPLEKVTQRFSSIRKCV